MSSQESVVLSARKSCALLLASAMLPLGNPALPSAPMNELSPAKQSVSGYFPAFAARQFQLNGRHPYTIPVRVVIARYRISQEQAANPAPAPDAAQQQITLAENGNPIALADVALVLANMNKVSLGKTDVTGKTTAAALPTDTAEATNPLNIANLNKVELHAEVDECVNGSKQVYLVGPGGKLPPPSKDCKRHPLKGTFFWGQAAQVVLDLGLGTLTNIGRPAAQQQPQAQKRVPPGTKPQATEQPGQKPGPQTVAGGQPGAQPGGQAAIPGQQPGAQGVVGGQQPGAQAGGQAAIGEQRPGAQGVAGGQQPIAQPGGQAGVVGQQPGAQTTPKPPPPGAIPLADEATRSINKALDDYFGHIADHIPGDKDPTGIQRGKVDKQALLMVQQVYMRDLINYGSWIGKMQGGSDAEINTLLDQLEKDKEGVYAAYAKMQWASSGFNPLTPDRSASAEKARYEALLRDAAFAEEHGDPRRAAMLRQFAKESPWGEFLPFQRRFYEALDKNPLLGIKIKGTFSDGDYLFNVLRNFRTDRYNTNAEVRDALRQLIRDHLQAFRDQTTAELDRVGGFANLVDYWELASPRFSRQQEQVAQMGPFAQSLMNALLGAQEGFAATQAVDEGWKNFWISVVVAGTALIPVVGPFASAGIQLYHDGKDLVIAYVDNANVENAAGVLGYVERIDTAEKLSDAKFRTLIAAAMFLPTVPGAVADLRKAGIKLVHRATAATRASQEAEAAAAATKIGTDLPKGVTETPGWAPGRQPIDEKQAEKALRDFVAHQDKVGGVQEVEAEIRLAKEAKVPEKQIEEITKYYKPDGSPLNNKTIATELMKARLQALGYDVTMTGEEFNALQGISVRSGPKGAGLTQKDIDFLRTKLTADPKYFEKLPQRGYVTDFLKDKWYEQLRPQEGFIAGLDAESAAAIQSAFQRWNKAAEASPALRQFENAVRNKVPVEQLKDEVMALKADPQAMRSLKNAPNEVKDAFNTAEALVYKQHDDAVVSFIKNTKLDKQGKPAPWAQPGVEVKVDDFRTPGGNSVGVNTDRDYRFLYKDPQKGWLEVPKEYWQNYSTEQFALASGYTPDKLRQIASHEDIAAWQAWDPAKHHGETVEQAMQDKWKELHQQLGTDKYHPEASVEFSDQGIVTGRQAQVNANIKAVKKGEELLKDAEGFGMMYNEKADAYMRLKSAIHPEGDKLEAMAQLNKGIDMLNDVRTGYGKFFAGKGAKAPLSALPDNFQEAAKAIQKLGPFDKTITADQIKQVEDLLRSLGFAGPDGKGDPLRGFVKALDGQFEALKTVQAPAVIRAGAGAPAGAGAGLPGAAAGPAVAAGAKAVNAANNAAGGGKPQAACASGSKRLNLDQYYRMRVLLLMQAQGVSPRDPSRYSDLPSIDQLDPIEQNMLADDMATGASRVRDLGDAASEKVYNTLATRLNWGGNNMPTRAAVKPSAPANTSNANAGAAGNNTAASLALGQDVRPGDYVALNGIVQEFLAEHGQNFNDWKVTRNPGGSVTFTPPDGRNSFTASFVNGQIVLQPSATPVAVAGGGQPATDRVALGKDVRPGDYTSMDAIIRDFLKTHGQNPTGWVVNRNPGGSVTYTSPDGKMRFAADIKDGQVVLQPAAANTAGNTSAGGAVQPAGGANAAGGNVPNPGGAGPQAPCPEAEQVCAAEQTAYDDAVAEYDTINRALRDAVILVETTGPALSAAGAAAGALKQGDPGYAESQALLKQAKADDEAAVKEQARLLGEKETAKTKMDKADEALKKCLADAAEKCKKKTAATTPQQNPGQNTAVGGAAAGGTDKPATGGTDAGTQPAGGNTVGGGATPGAAKTCKRSDDECAQLGVIAHQKQLEALRAQDDLRHVPDWLSQADSLQSSANSYHSMADGAFSAASKSAFDKNAANEAFYKQQGHEAQAKGDALQKQAKELRDKAEGAQGVADAAAAASKEAWKQYYDCLRLPPCPKDSNNTMNGSNVIGGTATGGLVNAAGGAGATGTSFSNCPAAQKQLDEARDWYQQASIAAANMQQALLAGDMQAAQFLQDSIVQDLHFARNHEQMAAYELAKCKDKPTNATAGGNPTNALNTGSNTTPEKKPPTGTNSGGGNAQPATNANSVGAATPAPANSIGGNTNPGANNNATAGGTNAAVPAPPETAASACMPGSDDCITPNQCISDSGCMNIKDICKTSPNACSKNKSGDSIYQVMMTASAINFGKVAERRKNLRYLSASYHLDRVLEPRISSALLRDKEAPAQDKKNENLDVALVATGNSSGEAFQLQMRDPSGKTKRMSMPEGMVLEPEKPGSSKPPAANGMSNLLTQQIGGFCMQFLKLPPAVGMIYKIAGPAMQQKFEPMRLILQAGRALAEKGKLHPDSEPQAYADSVRQYAVWANQEGWDEKKFGDNFVDRTHKNAEAKKIKWTPQIENALRAAVPGRWRDITQVLSVAHAWESSRNHASN